jgi:hypothetical protein
MKKTALLVFGIFFITLMGCDNEDTTLPTPPAEPELSDQEILDLAFLREEEKLARDVYLYAFDKYGTEVFTKIAGSEQVHMDEVKVLLDKYKIADPASTEKGVFSNTDLQSTYNDLIAMVDTSLVGGLTAGMIIEDMDMFDIARFESNTEMDDILVVYDFLKCTSKNHMRFFSYDLTDAGGSYSPQFISQAEYDEIIGSAVFMCR